MKTHEFAAELVDLETRRCHKNWSQARDEAVRPFVAVLRECRMPVSFLGDKELLKKIDALIVE
jgi:hypothetical protein